VLDFSLMFPEFGENISISVTWSFSAWISVELAAWKRNHETAFFNTYLQFHSGLRRFPFTLTNPHDIEALKREFIDKVNRYVILPDNGSGPSFDGNGHFYTSNSRMWNDYNARRDHCTTRFGPRCIAET
jgi:hypothetical protein